MYQIYWYTVPNLPLTLSRACTELLTAMDKDDDCQSLTALWSAVACSSSQRWSYHAHTYSSQRWSSHTHAYPGQHTSAYVSILRTTSAYVSKRQHTSAYYAHTY